MSAFDVFIRLLALIVGLFLIGTLHASDVRFIGKAYSLANDELLYVENHQILVDSQGNYIKGTVQYRDPNGQLFAYKALNFTQDLLQPELHFIDERDGSSLQVQNFKGYLEILKNEGDERKSQKVNTSSNFPSIVDAGFDRFVIANWGDLVDGKKLPFEFFALTRGEFVPFYIQKNSLSNKYLDLEISPKNWLVKILMKPIQLRYERSTKQLKEFKGVTNIRAKTENGLSDDNYRARIQYDYISPATENGV